MSVTTKRLKNNVKNKQITCCYSRHVSRINEKINNEDHDTQQSKSWQKRTIVRSGKGRRFMTATRLSELDNHAKTFLLFELWHV